MFFGRKQHVLTLTLNFVVTYVNAKAPNKGQCLHHNSSMHRQPVCMVSWEDLTACRQANTYSRILALLGWASLQAFMTKVHADHFDTLDSMLEYLSVTEAAMRFDGNRGTAALVFSYLDAP